MSNPSQPAPESLSRDKKGQILEVAKRRILQTGVNKTTMRDLADDMGIAVSNLYLYFKNKREIVLAIAEFCREEQELAAEALLSRTDLSAAQKLEVMLVSRFQATKEFKDEAPKGAELMAYLIAEAPESILDWRQRFEDAIRAILEDGNRNGEFCFQDVPQSAHFIYLALGGYFLPPHIDLPIPPQEEDLRLLIRWLLAPWTLQNNQR